MNFLNKCIIILCLTNELNAEISQIIVLIFFMSSLNSLYIILSFTSHCSFWKVLNFLFCFSLFFLKDLNFFFQFFHLLFQQTFTQHSALILWVLILILKFHVDFSAVDVFLIHIQIQNYSNAITVVFYLCSVSIDFFDLLFL